MVSLPNAGGEFCFPEKKELDPTAKINILTQLRAGFNLPVDDDYLYEEFGIEKPANYEQVKKEREDERTRKEAAAARIREQDGDGGNEEPEPPSARKKSFRNRLAGFFAKAPDHGAALEW